MSGRGIQSRREKHTCTHAGTVSGHSSIKRTSQCCKGVTPQKLSSKTRGLTPVPRKGGNREHPVSHCHETENKSRLPRKLYRTVWLTRCTDSTAEKRGHSHHKRGTPSLFLSLVTTVCVCVCACLHLHTHHGAHVEAREQTSGTGSLRPPCGSRGMNSGPQLGGRWPYLLSHLTA